ncbi:glycosyltransferase [bacterium]|nr:glycosyltransferase [bacterium]
MTGQTPHTAEQRYELNVSIIIPVYDKLELTRQCLESIWRHTPGDRYEIIVVDNGSTDGTAEYLRELEDAGSVKALIQDENLGFARGCNRGAAAARGRYLLFLNNDTEVTEGWLSPLLQTLDQDPYVGAVGNKLLFPDGTIQHAGVALVLEDRPQGQVFGARHVLYRKSADSKAANQPQIMRALTAACLMVRSEAFFKVVGFDEAYWNGNEDVDLCLKLGEAGWRLVYRPESVVVHHESQSGPQRWTGLSENQKRLDKRWHGRVHPDYFVSEQGEARPAENFSIRSYAPPRLRFEGAAPRPQDPPTASVIVLTHNALDYTQTCAEALLAHTDPRHEIVFVDNASSDGTVEWLAGFCESEERCRAVYNQENLGFAAGNNVGLANAAGDYLVLLNSDVVVTAGWLDKLIACAEAHPQAGIVGPVTNSITGAQKLPKVGYDQETLRDLDLFARMHGDAVAGQDEPALWVVGFCMLIKREVLSRIGGLDERYGLGNFEDTDYCLRNFLAGYQTLIAMDCFVHHYGSRSFAAAKVDYRKSLETNWEIFKEKWGIPPTVAYGEKFDLEGIILEGHNPVLHFHPLPRARGLMPIEPTPGELCKRLGEGEDLFRAGRIVEAETLFRYVLYWNTDDRRAANNLAVALWKQNKVSEAGEVLEDLLLQEPGNVDARYNLEEIRKDISETVENRDGMTVPEETVKS